MGAGQRNRQKEKGECARLFSEDYFVQNIELELEEIESLLCCGITFQKSQKKTISWEERFIGYCRKIQGDFPWATDMIQTVNNCRMPKEKYLTEVHELKKHVFHRLNRSDDAAIDRGEVQTFKKRLRESMAVCRGNADLQSTLSIEKDLKIKSSMVESVDEKKIEVLRFSSSVAESGISDTLKKSVLSIAEDTFSQILEGQLSVSKSTCDELDVFIRFTSILESHLKDICCILGRLTRLFIVYVQKKYRGKTMQRDIGDFVDDVKQFLLLIREGIIDYHALSMFRNKQLQNTFIANNQNILSICMTVLFKDPLFYKVAFELISQHCSEKDQLLIKAIEELQHQGPEYFTVKDRFCLNERTLQSFSKTFSKDAIQIPPYSHSVLCLSQIVNNRSPISKIKAIMACSQSISQQIQRFYTENSLPRDNWLLDADQVLSIFCYLVKTAKIANLHAHLFMAQHFSTDHQMMSMPGYYVSVIRCGVEQLMKETQLSKKGQNF